MRESKTEKEKWGSRERDSDGWSERDRETERACKQVGVGGRESIVSYNV